MAGKQEQDMQQVTERLESYQAAMSDQVQDLHVQVGYLISSAKVSQTHFVDEFEAKDVEVQQLRQNEL